MAEHQPVLMLRENKEIVQDSVAVGVYNADVSVRSWCAIKERQVKQSLAAHKVKLQQ